MTAVQLDKSGKASGKVEIPDIFTRKPKVSLLHEAVVRHLANRRAGTADTKRRDEVSGGGRKPWRQKGTGRARQGSIRSPLWRKGGVVFGPHPRSYAKQMNKSARRSALAMAIAAKAEAGLLNVIDAAALAVAKTKELEALLWPENQTDTVLVAVDAAKDSNAKQLWRAARNLRRAKVQNYDDLSVHSILRHERLVMSPAALAALAEVCGG
ncbi:MAG TPA: 50S ribosomal protein L4 [Candidatus Acidoferrales bacterium]|nr:50S ribosomal protein L4 [Candidatus Acidoferrales bacterium]